MNKILETDINLIINRFPYWEKLENSVVMVVGATSFLGSIFIKALLKSNMKIKIIGICRDIKKAHKIFKKDELKQIQFLDRKFENMPKCEYLVDFISPTKSKFFIEHPVETMDVSIDWCRWSLEYARKNNSKKVIYISSMEEYGTFEKNIEVDEFKIGYIDHMQVRSSYPLAKRICELYSMSYYKEFGVNVVIARLSQTFGAGVDENDNRLFMQLANSVIENKDIILHTDGSASLNFVYSADAIIALLFLLVEGNNGEVYNICNDNQHMTVMDVASLVAKCIANNRISVKVDINPKKQYGYAPKVMIQLSSRKIRDIGWIPTISVQNAYERLIEYLKCERGL